MSPPAWRGPRRTAPPHQVARYWAERGLFVVDLFLPACFGCGGWEEAWGHLERAHLIDRVGRGLDGPQNLALLCRVCHASQPMTEAGDEAWILAWLIGRRWRLDPAADKAVQAWLAVPMLAAAVAAAADPEAAQLRGKLAEVRRLAQAGEISHEMAWAFEEGLRARIGAAERRAAARAADDAA